MKQMELIFQALDIICASRIWQDRTPSHTLKLLMYLHNKGWLYTPSEDGKVKIVIGAYRIPEITDEILGVLPISESGTILYVPFVISLDKEEFMYNVVRRAMRTYLELNPDITEIVLEGKDDKLRRYKLDRELQGAINGKE